MVVYEIVQGVADFVAPFVGIEGATVTGLGTIAVVLYYLRELADVLVVVARWTRIASIVVGAVALLFAIGTHLGVIDLAGGSLVAQIVQTLDSVIH